MINKIEHVGYVSINLFDFKLENSEGSNEHNYEYKFPIITFDNGNILIKAGILVLNSEDSAVIWNSLGSKSLNYPKTFIQASFDINHFFYYFTYNNVSDFISGYSNSYVDFSSKDAYISNVNSMQITQNSYSPFSFIDDVEIKEMNFIRGTQYVYYEIYNKNKDKSYYKIKQNIA